MQRRAGPASLLCQVPAGGPAAAAAAAAAIPVLAQLLGLSLAGRMAALTACLPSCPPARPLRFLLLPAVWRLGELGGPYSMDPGFLYDGMRK